MPNESPGSDGLGRAAETSQGTLWFDVGDLLWWPFDYLSGIQRVQLSVLCELRVAPPCAFEIRYCRFLSHKGFLEVEESDIAACITRLSDTAADTESAARTRGPQRSLVASLGAPLAGLYRRLPERLALVSGTLLLGFGDRVRVARDRAKDLLRRANGSNRAQVACGFKKDDLLLNLGSSWVNAGYARGVERAKMRHGIRYAVLICDLIPWIHPRWFNHSTRIRFLPWARQTLRSGNLILAISCNTRHDIERLLESEGLPLPDIEVIRLGDRPPPARDTWEPGPKFRDATSRAGFVLSVGTIERRKNHRLLFEVWRELLRNRNNGVPALVWAGRGGWLTEDLMEQVVASDYLNGKLIILGGEQGTGVSEAALRFLYENCLFTLFPSRYEGWGLPVAESIAFGKYCIASDASSIPEVAGDLVDYHAPDDFARCYELVERAIFDPEHRAGRESRIRSHHQAYGWGDCARSICEKIVDWQNRRGSHETINQPLPADSRAGGATNSG